MIYVQRNSHDTHDIPLTPAHNTFPQTFAVMQTLTVKCKLVLSKEQREALDTTMRAFAAACNDAIAVGRRLNTTSNIRIHRWAFYDLRIKIAYKCALAGVLYELLTLYACGYVYPLKIMATLAKQNSGS